MRAFAGAEPVVVRRWSSWSAGVAQGALSERTTRLVFAPTAGATDPGGRRGLLIPQFDVFGERDADLQPHDLVERSGGDIFDVAAVPQRWTSPYTTKATGMQCTVTQLVDDGPETVDVFLTVNDDDGYGTVLRRPAEEATRVSGVSVEPAPGRESGQLGQDAPALYRVAGRGLPEGLDAFSAIEWPVGSGRRFEVVGTPLRWPWPPWAAYTAVTIREK